MTILNSVIRRIRNSSWVVRTFILITLVEAIIDCVILGFVLATFQLSELSQENPTENSVLPVYLSIFVLAHVFQLYYAVDAIWQKNSIQIWGLCIFQFMFLGTAILEVTEMRAQFGEARATLSSLVIVLPVVVGLCAISYCILSYWLFKEFGWTIWKRIGADRQIKKIYMKYQIFLCILKFDYFFFIAFSIQYYFLVYNVPSFERYLTIAAVPVSLIILFLGYVTARKEIKWLMYLFFFGCTAGAAYFVFKLFRIYDGKDADYRLVVKSLTLFACICLILLILTMTFGILVLRSYGLGLRYHISKNPKKKLDDSMDMDFHDGVGQFELKSSNPNRMSID